MTSTNAIVCNAMCATKAADVAENMSAQQAVTLVEMEIGKGDDEAENLLEQYGRLIRSQLGEKVYRDLYERAVAYNGRRW